MLSPVTVEGGVMTSFTSAAFVECQRLLRYLLDAAHAGKSCPAED